MSKIEVNTVAPQCGTTLTLGESGDTVTLGAGASQTGFGRTGTVDWQTTPKTTTFTAVNGEGYFCNTGGGAFTCNLPAGTAGAIVSVQDYNNTFDTEQLTIQGNGSDKINAGTAGGLINLSTEGQGLTLVYVDSTVGWRSIEEQSYATSGTIPSFVTASVSGACNTLTTAPDCSNVKVAKFVNPGTFTVCSVGNPSGSDTVDYLVIAGGASGGNGGGPSGGSGSASGGGGAGGYRESGGTASGCYTVSPAGSSPSPVAALPVSATGYPITVGGGGAVNGPSPSAGQQGNPGDASTFSTITSAGGGTGGGWSPTPGSNGLPGGSGGGASQNGTVGAGNTPPVSPPQGKDGGLGPAPNGSGGGGGGATVAGGVGTAASPGPANAVGGTGGTGATSAIDGTPTGRGGGGSGGVGGDPGPPPGTLGPVSDGGGAGGNLGVAGSAGTINTGGGGGGGGANPGKVGGLGGSGIVIIRYKFQ
jgi:hypothetical protein